MKLNGNLTLNAGGASQIENAIIERVATLPTVVPAEAGRIVFLTSSNVYYYNTGSTWSAFATGGNAAALQTEVDAVEGSLGTGVAANGTFVPASFTGFAAGATSFTDAINLVAAAVAGKDQLSELLDVTITTPATGQFLQKSAGNWVNHTLVLADVSNVTATATEVNELHLSGVTNTDLVKLHAMTPTAAEINILSGVTGVTAAELSYIGDVTGLIQNQLDGKQPLDATLTGIAALTPSVNPNALIFTSGTDTFSFDSGIGARSKLGLAIGADVQAFDADLLTIAGFTPIAGALTGNGTTIYDIMVATGTAEGARWSTQRGATARSSLGMGDVATHDDIEYIRVNGTHQYTANQSLGGFKIISLGTPVDGTDAANKTYVDSLSSGLVWINSVDAINLIAMDTVTPVGITSHVRGDIYVVPPTGGAAWGSHPGHIMVWDGAAFLDKGPVSEFNMAGRAIVSGYSATVATGSLAGKDNQIAQFTFPYDYPIIGVNTGTKTFTVAGDKTGVALPVGNFYVGGSTGNDEYYTIVSKTLNGGNTDIVVIEVIPSATVNGNIYDMGSPTFTVPANKNAVYVSNVVSQYAYSQFVYDVASTSWTLFGGNTALVPGVGLSQTGNIMNVNLGAGIAELPTDEIGIDIYSSTGGLILTTDGSTHSTATNAQLHLKLDLTSNGKLIASSAGVKVDVNTISESELTASVAGNGLTGGNGTALAVVSAIGTPNTVGTLVIGANSVGVSLGTLSTDAAPGNHIHAAGVVTFDNSVALMPGTPTNVQDALVSLDGRADAIEAFDTAIQTEVDAIEAAVGLSVVGAFVPYTGKNYINASTSIADASVKLDTALKAEETARLAVNTRVTNSYHLYSSLAPNTTHVVTHSTGQQYCNVTVVDAADEVIIPQSIVFNTATQLTVTFNTAIDCKVVVMGVA